MLVRGGCEDGCGLIVGCIHETVRFLNHSSGFMYVRVSGINKHSILARTCMSHTVQSGLECKRLSWE